MTKRKSDFTLPMLDDRFSTQAERDDAKLERVKNIRWVSCTRSRIIHLRL